MALTFPRVLETARQAKVLADDTVRLLTRIRTFIDFNSDQAIDWGAGNGTPGNGTPSYITEDADFNIDGLPFSRQDIANAIGSMDKIRKLLMNEDPGGAGDHLGNFNKIAQPVPLQR